MIRSLILFALMSFISTSAHAANLSPSEAQKHIGETATVCGTVAPARYADRSKGSPTFLNLGHAYPNAQASPHFLHDIKESSSRRGIPDRILGPA